MCHPPNYYLHLNFFLQTYMLCNVVIVQMHPVVKSIEIQTNVYKFPLIFCLIFFTAVCLCWFLTRGNAVPNGSSWIPWKSGKVSTDSEKLQWYYFLMSSSLFENYLWRETSLINFGQFGVLQHFIVNMYLKKEDYQLI